MTRISGRAAGGYDRVTERAGSGLVSRLTVLIVQRLSLKNEEECSLCDKKSMKFGGDMHAESFEDGYHPNMTLFGVLCTVLYLPLNYTFRKI